MSEFVWIEAGPGRQRLVRRDRVERTSGAAPHVISDNAEIVSQIDGKTYTSKRGYERHVRENGCIVVGNETAAMMRQADRPRASNRDFVERAFAQHGF